MKTFLFILLAGYAVRCDDSYYVVQRPKAEPKQFKVYWNVPTMQCKSKKIPFDDLFEKYGIIQNTQDTHRGDKISILYDPGKFPALIKNESTGEIRYRNGGVPQQGELIDHLQIFKYELDKSILDKDFSGLGIIDFESWRPILRQNFGILTPYKDVSFDIEKKRHWWWKKQWIQEEAQRRFETSARDFMQTTLALAKKLRPKALWGYYGYPQCFNRPHNNNPEQCAKEIPEENDNVDWLWSESTALYPSVYSTQDMSAIQLAAFIKGRIKEAVRVKANFAPILPYWWFRYRDGGYFSEADLDVAFSTFYQSNATGFIIWGSSKDVNTREKCIKLKTYVINILGPAVAKYTKYANRLGDVIENIHRTTVRPEVVTQLDPEYNWIPPENYSQNIEHIVDQELKKDSESPFDKHKKVIESILIDLILHKIAYYCSENCGSTSPNYMSSEAPVVLTTKDPFKDTAANSDKNVSLTTEEMAYYDSEASSATQLETTTRASEPSETTELSTNTIIMSTTEARKHIFNNYQIIVEEIDGTSAVTDESTTHFTSSTVHSESTQYTDIVPNNVWRVGHELTARNNNSDDNKTNDIPGVINSVFDEINKEHFIFEDMENKSSKIGIVDVISNETKRYLDEVTENSTSSDEDSSKTFVTDSISPDTYFGKISKYFESKEVKSKEIIDDNTTFENKYDSILDLDDSTTSLSSYETTTFSSIETSNRENSENTNKNKTRSSSTIKWNIRFRAKDKNNSMNKTSNHVYIKQVVTGSASRATTSPAASIVYMYIIIYSYLGSFVCR